MPRRKNVSHLRVEIGTTQLILSQHLSTLCREVCTQVAIKLDSQASLADVSAGERRLPAGLR